jgi:hypothetical protein
MVGIFIAMLGTIELSLGRGGTHFSVQGLIGHQSDEVQVNIDNPQL